MVDGVHGAMDHVVRHVQEEHKSALEYVTILLLPVVEVIAQGQRVVWFHATSIAVVVRLLCIYIVCNTLYGCMVFIQQTIWQLYIT